MAFVFIACTGISGIAWQNSSAAAGNYQQDTFPKKNETVINGDLDKALEQVRKAKENLDKQLQNQDWGKLDNDLAQSFQFDAEKIQAQLAKAMKQIDMQKIQLQAQAALKQVNWQKAQEDMQKSQQALVELKAIDMEKMKRELQKATENLKLNESRLKADIDKARNSLQQNLPKKFEKEIEKARAEVARAEAELQNYKEMVVEMDKDNLLNAEDTYSIEYDHGDLIIDGKKQPEAVANKYRHYFKKEKVKIKKEKDDNNSRTIYL